MRLVCTRWDWSVLAKTALSHMRLLCPIWNCSVSYEIALFHVRLLCPMWDCSIPFETTLFHVRLLCPLGDCSVPCETTLFLRRLLCPMWDYSVPCGNAVLHETAFPNEIASNIFCNAQRSLYFLSFLGLFTFLGLICPFWDWILGRDRDRQDWDNPRTELLRHCKEIQA